jgi:hypothetical protein
LSSGTKARCCSWQLDRLRHARARRRQQERERELERQVLLADRHPAVEAGERLLGPHDGLAAFLGDLDLLLGAEAEDQVGPDLQQPA